MNHLRILIRRLWDSPTVTSWMSLATKSLRLVILLPLILRRFSATEAAAWLMFSSLLFFGTLISAQINLLFSRLIAMAMSGAEDLSPITHSKEVRGKGEPNWIMVRRVYSTVGFLNAIVAGITGITALAMGVYGLQPMLAHYGNSRKVWLAFLLVIVGEVVAQMQQKYTVALRGMNFFSLTNRWDVVFALASTLAGSLALWLGATILPLAMVMQSVIVIGSFRYLLVLRSIEPRFKEFEGRHYDRAILKWAWPPFIKSLAQSFASNGAIKVGAVVFARYGEPRQVASLLLTLRLFDMMWSFSTAPVTSKIPRYSRMLAEGRMENLRSELMRSLKFGQWVLVASGLGVVFLLKPLLNLMKSEVVALPLWILGSLVAGFIVVSTIRHWLLISLAGNHVVAVNGFILSALASTGLCLVTFKTFGLPAFALSVFLPAILLVNWQPLTAGAGVLQIPRLTVARNTIFLPWMIFTATLLLAFLL